MSFGPSVGDLVKAGKFAFDLYQACERAPDVFQEASKQCLSIYIAIGQAERCLPHQSTNLSSTSHQNSQKLSAITTACWSTLKQLQALLDGYSSLGTAAPKLWSALKFGTRGTKEELAEIRLNLGVHLHSLSVLMLGFQGEQMDTLQQTLSRIELNTRSNQAGTHDNSSNILLASLEQNKPIIGAPPLYSQVSESNDFENENEESCLKQALAQKRATLQDTLDQHPELKVSLTLCSAADQCIVQLPEKTAQYSRHDEWLCDVPEGWQRIKLAGDQYRYRYLFGRKPIMSRSYHIKLPFDPTVEVLNEKSLPEGWIESGHGRLKHYQNCNTKAKMLERPTFKIKDTSQYHYVGWITDTRLPIDLDDICSVELANALFVDQSVPLDDIQSSLPDGWQCLRDDSTCHLIYVFSNQKEPSWSTTVHPAYFSSDKFDPYLPPGWDYRLDSWGNTFYVDHHRKAAQYLHPREDTNVNYITGLRLA